MALTAIAAVACLIDVESIIFTLPLLSVAGLVLMIAARSLRSPVVLAHGLLAPAINLCSFQAIVWFNLGPAFAQTPLSILLSLYTISVAPLAIWALAKLRRWESEANVNRPYRWQFGMRTLMIAMTVLAITLGALSLVAKNIPGSTGMPRVEFVIFVGYQIWLVLATGAAAAWCLLRGPDPGHLNSSASA